MKETYEATKKRVRSFAQKDFAQHVLEETGPNEWWCHRPNTGMYSFRVIVRPSMVCIWGDVGEGIFRGGEAGDTLAWLKEAVYSPEYLMGKLRPQPEQAYYPDDALGFAREVAEANRPLWTKILKEAESLYRRDELNAHTWASLVYEETGDGENCMVGRNYCGASLWLVEALRWLVEHLPVSEAQDAVAK